MYLDRQFTRSKDRLARENFNISEVISVCMSGQATHVTNRCDQCIRVSLMHDGQTGSLGGSNVDSTT